MSAARFKAVLAIFGKGIFRFTSIKVYLDISSIINVCLDMAAMFGFGSLGKGISASFKGNFQRQCCHC
jgi:hypothetical protein